jgi:response regulator RpfG family c-di-GMP phosphodiesterase
MAHTLLLVDDEANILKALGRLLRRTGHELLTAAGGEEALAILGEHPVSLVVSDQRMPGMTGVELLQRARELQPEAVRIILTGYTDIQAAMQAINEGAVYRFLTKPWDDQALLDTVAQALADLDMRREHAALQEKVAEQNQQLQELNQGLERKVQERTNELEMALKEAEKANTALRQQNLLIVKSFAGLLDLRHPRLGAHCRRVAGKVQELGARLGVTNPQEIQDTLIAALLHDLGKIALPDTILVKDVAHLGPTERDEVKKHAVLGEGQLQVVEGLVGIARLVRHHHENVDGSGYPDGLRDDAIPLGARILRVLDTYDNVTKGGARRGGAERLALEAMDRQVGKQLDGRVFDALLDVLDKRSDAYDSGREEKIPLKDLIAGMILSRDLSTKNGILLMPKDEKLHSEHLEKIKNYCAIYSVDPYAYVVR